MQADTTRRGRPPLDENDPSVYVGSRVPGRVGDALDRLAARQGRRRSELVREAITRYVADAQVAS